METQKTIPKVRTTTVQITGMHCASCDIFVRQKLRESTVIVDVQPDVVAGTAKISHTGDFTIDELNELLCDRQYRVVSHTQSVTTTPWQERYLEIGVLAGIVGVVYFLLQDLGVYTFVMSRMGGNNNLWGALIFGFFASLSSCMATTGALYMSAIRHVRARTIFTLLFLSGRVLGYAAFGYIVGYIGSEINGIQSIGVYLQVVVSIFIVISGMDMLGMLQLAKFRWWRAGGVLVDRAFSQRITAITGLFLGIMTYFLPCGFSLSMQAYALNTTQPLQSALLMGVFALGSLPAIIAMQLLTRIRGTQIHKYVMYIVGIVTIAVGISQVYNFLLLRNMMPIAFRINSHTELAPVIEGKQYIHMVAKDGGYYPNHFTVRQHIPVKWEVTGEQIMGCQGSIQAPAIGISLQNIKEGKNILEFTPTQRGVVHFSCSMGMFTGTVEVI